MKLRRRVFLMAAMALPGLCGCASRSFNTTESDPATHADSGTHLVIGAESKTRELKLWICSGAGVASQSKGEGYPVGIGDGDVAPTSPHPERVGLHAMPMGAFEITSMVGSGRPAGTSCGSPGFQGMTTRCIGLRGTEPGVNDDAVARGIYIHGARANAPVRPWRSVSQGSVRMSDDDVLAVSQSPGLGRGTKVFISSGAAPFESGGQACSFAAGRHGAYGNVGLTLAPIVCTAPDLSLFARQGTQLALMHGRDFQERPRATVNASGPREPGYPYTLFLEYTATDVSNLYLKPDGNGKTLRGYRKSLSWGSLGATVPFTAVWSCNRWVGAFRETEPLEIVP